MFIVVVLLSIVISFSGVWAVRDVDWKLYKFIIALMDGALYYFIAAVLVLENPNEIESCRSYYYKNKHKFFLGMLFFLFYVQIHSIVLTDQEFLHPARLSNLVALIPIYLFI